MFREVPQHVHYTQGFIQSSQVFYALGFIIRVFCLFYSQETKT